MDTHSSWVRHNPNTNTYDTPDGTRVAAELVDNVNCMADVLHIATIRDQQRHACSRDANQDRGPACPRHPYPFQLDQSAPEGAYQPEPVYTESKALKIASNIFLVIFVALVFIAIGGPFVAHFYQGN